MARLVSAGAESQVAPTGTANPIEGPGYLGTDTNKPTIATDIVRAPSTACWKMTLTLQRVQWSWTGANSVTYFSRGYIYIDSAALGAILTIGEWQTAAATTIGRVRLDTDLTVKATDSANNVLGTSAALSTGQWALIESSIMTTVSAGADDAFEVKVNGTVIFTSTTRAIGTAAPARWVIGPATLTGSITMRVDDVAINDSTGANQTGYPGPGSIVHLNPVSDNARTGWTAGAGGTTSLFDALDNRPPVGVVEASATNTSQIHDPTNNTTDTFAANLTDYATAGVASQPTLVEARAVIGNSTTTSRSVAAQSTSNPAITEASQASGTTAAATYPTGWTAFSVGIAYAPSVTLGTQPVMRVRKATASTDSAQCCAMFLVVDHVPPLPPGLGRPRTARQGRMAAVSAGRF